MNTRPFGNICYIAQEWYCIPWFEILPQLGWVFIKDMVVFSPGTPEAGWAIPEEGRAAERGGRQQVSRSELEVMGSSAPELSGNEDL